MLGPPNCKYLFFFQADVFSKNGHFKSDPVSKIGRLHRGNDTKGNLTIQYIDDYLFSSMAFGKVHLLSGVSYVLESAHPSGSTSPVSEDSV